MCISIGTQTEDVTDSEDVDECMDDLDDDSEESDVDMVDDPVWTDSEPECLPGDINDDDCQDVKNLDIRY